VTKRLGPWPNPIGWRVSAVIRGGLAHYFLGHHDDFQQGRALTVCGCASWHDRGRLFPERMGRRRCKTCNRSATARGMQ
jgi:hypothetical protein